jgi:hypothetical protein
VKRLALVAACACACELQPPPRPPPPETPSETTGEDAVCRELGRHVTDVLIASATEATLKATYEHDRETIARGVVDACVKQRWSKATIECYRATHDEAAVRTCDRQRNAAAIP